MCIRDRLSVVRQPEQGKGKHYAEWQAEQDGKPSYHSMVKADAVSYTHLCREIKTMDIRCINIKGISIIKRILH